LQERLKVTEGLVACRIRDQANASKRNPDLVANLRNRCAFHFDSQCFWRRRTDAFAHIIVVHELVAGNDQAPMHRRRHVALREQRPHLVGSVEKSIG
jgi:hypothetical protein